ncbi:MAG TPA: response regulator [Bacteroidia bacterium]|jgi:CheY-like chemotaxis protein
MERLKRIAVVDDEEVFIFLARHAIERTMLVDQISVFKNGAAILNFIRDNLINPHLLPEIILLDLSMPILDGWEFLEEFEKLCLSNPLLIYICSSSISPDDISRAKNLRAVSDYIIKPVTKEKIIEIIKSI